MILGEILSKKMDERQVWVNIKLNVGERFGESFWEKTNCATRMLQSVAASESRRRPCFTHSPLDMRAGVNPSPSHINFI